MLFRSMTPIFTTVLRLLAAQAVGTVAHKLADGLPRNTAKVVKAAVTIGTVLASTGSRPCK